MAHIHPGQTATNPMSGETLTFRRTSGETSGELIEFDLELRPLGGPGGLPHRHVVAEHFEFSRGAVCAFIGSWRPRIVRAGETIDVPPNRWHFILALRRSEARVTIAPGMHFDDLLVTGAAVGAGEFRPRTLRRLWSLMREHGCV